MKMKKWMGTCLMASVVLTQSPVSVLANEFTEVDQTNLEMINEGEEQRVSNRKSLDLIQNEINNASSGERVKIEGHFIGSIKIPKGKKLTIEFSDGSSLTNAGEKQHTVFIDDGAELTITGKGTIVSKFKEAGAISNRGTVTLQGGLTLSYQRAESSNSNWYTVNNIGSMTVNDATIVNPFDSNASCVNNIGTRPGIMAVLTVNEGANIYGGLNAIKNGGYSKVIMTGGIITTNYQHAILNYDEVEVSGGVIENKNTDSRNAGIYNISSTDSKSNLQYYKGKVTISGNSKIKAPTAIVNTIEYSKNIEKHPNNSVEINGGTLIGTDCAIQADKNTETTITDGEIKGKLKLVESANVTASGGGFTEILPDSVKKPEGSTAHEHQLTLVSKAPTCTEDGEIEHYHCSICGKNYKDQNFTDLIDSIIVPATGHTYTWVIDKEPTKDHAGSKYQYCSVCHHKTDPVSIPAIGYTEKVENAVYRAYNPNNGEHLYTANYDEFRSITSIGWQDEGIAFMTESAKEGNPLYRVYNPNSGLHHYTIDENEKNVLVSLGWKDEDVTMYTSKKPQCAAVFRVYNPNGGQHHYTKDANERNVLVSLGWQDEGIAFRTAEIPTK